MSGLEKTYSLLESKNPRAGRAAPRDFLRAKPEGNPEQQLCQPKENPVHTDSFTRIYILSKIGF